jgi:hypothetical protein
LKPRKYGWRILGVNGELALVHDGDRIDTEGNLDDQGMYYYVVAEGTGMFVFFAMLVVRQAHGIVMTNCLFHEDLTHAVIDVDVIKMRTNITSRTCDDFRNTLLERDACCVWTGGEIDFGDALYISGVRKYVLQFCVRRVSDAYS